ncbi:hypothetical protein ACN23B_30225 (plasmid) [Anabaena sp. FACHB-709]|nr:MULTISPECIES: hypothetical protein [Nostocaceae]MBD2266206.1 hypothetical protein [Anabaena sp. FACHB-709]MBD2275937.1 hypothetical protein [Nostoc sp. PCC 7120 = FACHB-418]MBD2352737.1 hypothetical protein [Trichormus variabilis FACHB-171]
MLPLSDLSSLYGIVSNHGMAYQQSILAYGIFTASYGRHETHGRYLD